MNRGHRRRMKQATHKATLDPDRWKRRAQSEQLAKMRPFAWALITLAFASMVAASAVGCGGSRQSMTPTIIRGTLGGLYGACQAVDVDDATWRRICDGVEASLPHLDQLGAGPAELPPDVAAREVTITIGGE